MGPTIIEPPLPSATLATWERFLKTVEALPDDDLGKAHSIDAAKRAIKRLKQPRQLRPKEKA